MRPAPHRSAIRRPSSRKAGQQRRSSGPGAASLPNAEVPLDDRQAGNTRRRVFAAHSPAPKRGKTAFHADSFVALQHLPRAALPRPAGTVLFPSRNGKGHAQISPRTVGSLPPVRPGESGHNNIQPTEPQYPLKHYAQRAASFPSAKHNACLKRRRPLLRGDSPSRLHKMAACCALSQCEAWISAKNHIPYPPLPRCTARPVVRKGRFRSGP